MTSPIADRRCIAFAGTRLVAEGDLAIVARAGREALDEEPTQAVLVFDSETSEPVEVDFRGSVDEVVARLGAGDQAPASPPAPRSPGRPKLGVVAREVTLLPRHWEWLSTQPGGASVTLRKLVEAARRSSGPSDRQRAARDASYRFMLAVAGNEPGFEEATRALWANDPGRFATLTEPWPVGVRDHVRELAAGAFGIVSSEPEAR